MNKNYIYLGLLALVIIGGGFLLFRYRSPAPPVGGYISTNVDGLPQAAAQQTVELKDGATYDLAAGYVKKKINGTWYRLLAYNGSIPGPLLSIPQGAEITVNFTNNTDLPALLHSHGVRVDEAFDGSQAAQQEMQPGETFAYKLKFPDAGLYWYHPHVREDYAQELGLYGGYLVMPDDPDYWSPVNREVALFLDDILIEDGRINLNKAGADRTLMGRFGNVMLVNGETDYSLSVTKGEVIRFFVTNAANARPFNFAIEGARMKLVGTDGGAYEKDLWKNSILLGPSERAVIEAYFETNGTFAIQNKTPGTTYTLGMIGVKDGSMEQSLRQEAAFAQLHTHPATIQSIDSFRQYFAKAPDKRLALTLDMSGAMMNMPGMGHGGHMMSGGQMMGGSMMGPGPDGIEWEDTNQMMNQMSDAAAIKWKIVDQDTGKENMAIDWSFSKDQPAKIRIFNDPKSMHPMQHPLHFHGQRFLVLARNSVQETNLVWKDTVFIPSGETVDILLDTSNPGTWMAHCHIAEHLEAGMMMQFKIQ